MINRAQMCNNATCRVYRQPTKLLGGCDSCGHPLVPYEPDSATLAKLVVFYAGSQGLTLTFDSALLLLETNPDFRAEWVARWRVLEERLIDHGRKAGA